MLSLLSVLKRRVYYAAMFKCRYRLVLIIASLAYSSLTNAQVSWNVTEILNEKVSSMDIFKFINDSKGFLWIGTTGGLYRYDGYEFKEYRHSRSDSTTIPGNSVCSMFIDRQKQLWIGTCDGGLCRYNEKKEQFIRVDLPAQTIYAIERAPDNPNILWLGTDSGLIKYHTQAGVLEVYKKDTTQENTIAQNTVISLRLQQNKLLIGLGGSGLNIFDLKTKKFNHYKIPNEDIQLGFKANVIRKIIPEDEDSYWLGTYGGVHLFNVSDGTFKSYYTSNSELSNNSIWDIVDKGEILYVASYLGGIDIFDKDTRRFKSVNGKFNNTLRSLYEDFQGNIWIGTNGNLYQYAPNAIKFKTLNFNSKFFNEYERLYLAATANENEWLVCQTSQIFRINSELEILHIYNLDFLKKGDLILAVVEHNNQLWLGTNNHGIYVYNLATQQLDHHFQNIPGDYTTLNHNFIRDYATDNEILWVSSIGLNKIDLHNKKILRLTNSFKIYNTLLKHAISDMEILDNKLWLTTNNGLYTFDYQEDTLLHYNSFSAKDLNKIVYDEARKGFWAISGGGVDFFDSDTKEVTNYFDRPTHDIALDQYGTLWFSTDQDLVNFDGKTYYYYNYKDGLGSGQGNLVFNGQLFYNTGTRLYRLDRSEILTNNIAPSLALTNFNINNSPVNIQDTSEYFLTQSLTTIKEIVIPHDVRMFSLEFSALNFVIPERNNYKYKLEGFQNDWITTNANNREATYTNIDPGTYTFLLSASNNDQVWSEPTEMLTIKVLPAPWATWWAYLLYFMLIIGVFSFIGISLINRRRYQRKLKIEHMMLEKMKEIDTLKTRFFTSISHEFRTPLTLISGPLEQLKNEIPENKHHHLDRIKRNADNLLRLINQLLDLAKLDAGKMTVDLKNVDIIRHLKPLVASFDSLSNGREIQFIKSFEREQLFIKCDIDKIEMIITNLLSNAVKFTKDKVWFMLYYVDNLLYILIVDNGKGISEDEKEKIFDRFYQTTLGAQKSVGTGIGLALVKELVELMGGNIELHCEPYEKTEFLLTLPAVEVDKNSVDTYAKNHLNISPFFVEHFDQISENKTSQVILVVEDHDDLQDFIKSALSEKYRVITASDGKEGLGKALEYIPDLIITDLMMPNMDGNELMVALRAEAKTDHIPIVALTAKSDEESKSKTFQHGADQFLTKPFSITELLSRINSALKQVEVRKEHFYKEFVSEPRKTEVISSNDRLLTKLAVVMESKMSDPELSVDQLAREIGLSRTQLHRKITALLGISTSEYIRNYRLKKAYQLLQGSKASVSEIAYECGFNDASYFARSFKKLYNMSPSAVLNHH